MRTYTLVVPSPKITSALSLTYPGVVFLDLLRPSTQTCWRLTVMENLLSGRLGYVSFWSSLIRRFPPADIENAFRLLDRVGLMEQADKRADALSGGQRQRVGIARALAQEPEILLVDEPTASLDPKTSRQIMRLLREVCAERGLAAIVNIHDVVLAREFMMRIVGLRAGVIVYDGGPDGLTPAVLTEIYGEEDWTASSDLSDTGPSPRPGVPDADELVSAL